MRKYIHITQYFCNRCDNLRIFAFRSASTKEEVARTATNVTEQLMTISRRMAAQVKQGQDTISTLGELL